MGLILGLPIEGRILQVTATSTEPQFSTIRACKEKLLNLPVGEEFCQTFIYYACVILLAHTKLDSYQNLWHRMDSEITSTGGSLCLTNLWKELGDINNQTPLGYMPVFCFYRY